MDSGGAKAESACNHPLYPTHQKDSERWSQPIQKKNPLAALIILTPQNHHLLLVLVLVLVLFFSLTFFRRSVTVWFYVGMVLGQTFYASCTP